MIQPLGDRLLVQKIDNKKVINGIYIPDSIQSDELKAKVVAVGPGKKLQDGSVLKINVNVGDVVNYSFETGHELQINKQNYIVLNNDDILFVYSEEENA